MPCIQVSVTSVLAGKPAPVTTGTSPGGPTAGVIAMVGWLTTIGAVAGTVFTAPIESVYVSRLVVWVFTATAGFSVTLTVSTVFGGSEPRSQVFASAVHLAVGSGALPISTFVTGNPAGNTVVRVALVWAV